MNRAISVYPGAALQAGKETGASGWFALYPQTCRYQPQNRTIWCVAQTTGPYGGREVFGGLALALTRLARRGAYAVTSVYGEQGAAGQVRRRGHPASPGPDGREEARQALELAARLHAADRRQREPDLIHYADLRVMPTSA